MTATATTDRTPKTPPAARSRVEGVLHRSLPATLAIRSAEDTKSADGLLRLRLSVSSEDPYLRDSGWEDPWLETLGHNPGEVDLVRLNDGAPVLANHDRRTATGNTPLAAIGAIEKAWLDGKKLMADVALSGREALADLRADIAAGLVRNVSIGYRINERVLTRAANGQRADEYRVTSWTPFEISLVDIPADATVGLGRSADGQTEHYRVIPLAAAASAEAKNDAPAHPTPQAAQQTPPAEGNPTRSTPMPEANTAPAATTAVADRTDNRHQTDPIAAERARIASITAVGRQWKLAELADKAIEDGTSLENFNARVLDAIKGSGQLRAAEDPAIGMSQKDVGNFSFAKAILAAHDPQNARNIAGFELECSRAAQDKRDKIDPSREHAVTIPVDVLLSGIGLSARQASQAIAMMVDGSSRESGMRAGRLGQRDLVVGTASAGGNLVATELLGSSFIELLRNAMVLDRLGITMLTDLNGNIAIPSQTGAATGYWVAENVAPTESQQALGQLLLAPKTVGAFCDFSRKLLIQSSISVEAFIRADLAAVIARMIQRGALSGAGSGGEPLGILNTSGVGSVAGGANGAAPTYAHMTGLQAAVGLANGDDGPGAFLTNSKVKYTLQNTQVFAGTNGMPVFADPASNSADGRIAGSPALITNTIPYNLTKGSASGICSAVVYGVWRQLILALWGGLDVMLDPYTGSAAGTRRVVALQDVDVGCRQVGAFATMKDALTLN